jgi:hypothetical protein
MVHHVQGDVTVDPSQPLESYALGVRLELESLAGPFGQFLDPGAKHSRLDRDAAAGELVVEQAIRPLQQPRS